MKGTVNLNQTPTFRYPRFEYQLEITSILPIHKLLSSTGSRNNIFTVMYSKSHTPLIEALAHRSLKPSSNCCVGITRDHVARAADSYIAVRWSFVSLHSYSYYTRVSLL